jgi:phage repressor protein C with HTH and peptisase S24 domain
LCVFLTFAVDIVTAKIVIIFNHATFRLKIFGNFILMQSLLDRIAILARSEGITIGALEKRIGASKAVLSRAIQNNTDIQSKWISRIVENFPSYSIDWLVTGEGEMLKPSREVVPAKTFQLRSDRPLADQDIPLYDLSATAGLVEIFGDIPQDPADHLRVPNLPAVDGAIYVKGDSMTPLLKSGDIIIYKKMDLSPDGILWGQIYLVSYTISGDSYTVVKYVKRSPVAGHIRLVSANDFYDPVDIPAGSVTALALVKASITFHTIE